MNYIDMRSDTVTRPTKAMWAAMANAEVGDDVYGDDPTINRLEALAAEILGFEAALFVPSGTMGNQLALLTHTRRGDEVILGSGCHIANSEVGAAAVLSAVTLRTADFPLEIPDVDMIERLIRGENIHMPPTSLICLENALANGRVVPEENMAAIKALAQREGLKVHLDGARIFNAAVALGVDVTALTRHVDSVSCCLSKGLCAPVGSVLASSAEFIARARKFRKMLGGGMRQAGILAAAGIIAITDMTKRLHIDHDNARYLARRLAELPNVTIDPDAIQINMVFFAVKMEPSALSRLTGQLKERGILVNKPGGNGSMRVATHNDISRDDLNRFVETLAELIA